MYPLQNSNQKGGNWHLDSLGCRVVREGEVDDGRECLDKDAPCCVDEDHHGCKDCLAMLPDAAEGPVLVGECSYAPCYGALLGAVAKPLDVEVDAPVACLVVAPLPELVGLLDLEGLEGGCRCLGALEVESDLKKKGVREWKKDIKERQRSTTHQFRKDPLEGMPYVDGPVDDAECLSGIVKAFYVEVRNDFYREKDGISNELYPIAVDFEKLPMDDIHKSMRRDYGNNFYRSGTNERIYVIADTPNGLYGDCNPMVCMVPKEEEGQLLLQKIPDTAPVKNLMDPIASSSGLDTIIIDWIRSVEDKKAEPKTHYVVDPHYYPYLMQGLHDSATLVQKGDDESTYYLECPHFETPSVIMTTEISPPNMFALSWRLADGFTEVGPTNARGGGQNM